MVAKIITSHGCYEPIRYNEKKVANNEAVCIHAGNFLLDAPEMTVVDKRQRFYRLEELNKVIVHNTLHVSLNFDSSENMEPERLIQISEEYMERIGFGAQPVLIYQHFDAGHPHVHLVSTNIRPDGTYIKMHNLGRIQSEAARKALEIKYRLIQGKRMRKYIPGRTTLSNVQKVQYGKSGTKRAVSDVLDFVLKNYKYCSLPELNAVLRLYNMQADPGRPGSRIYEHHGLVYQVLDENGRRRGNRLKASSFYLNPGLRYLQEKFSKNKVQIDGDLVRLRRRIDWVLDSRPVDWKALTGKLQQEGIHAVPYMNKAGFFYALTYVDTGAKIAASGAALGQAYGANSVFQKLDLDQYIQPVPDMEIEATQPNQDINRALDLLTRQEARPGSPSLKLSQGKKKKTNQRL